MVEREEGGKEEEGEEDEDEKVVRKGGDVGWPCL